MEKVKFKKDDVLITTANISHGINIPVGSLCLVLCHSNLLIDFGGGIQGYFRYYRNKRYFTKIGEL